MQQKKSKFAAAVLIAAIGVGAPALAKSWRGAKPVASHTNQIANRQHGRMPDIIGAGGWRAPTFGAPNPNHPSLNGGGSTGYNANLAAVAAAKHMTRIGNRGGTARQVSASARQSLVFCQR